MVYRVLDLSQNPESIHDYLKPGDQPEKEWQAPDICSIDPVGNTHVNERRLPHDTHSM